MCFCSGIQLTIINTDAENSKNHRHTKLHIDEPSAADIFIHIIQIDAFKYLKISLMQRLCFSL